MINRALLQILLSTPKPTIKGGTNHVYSNSMINCIAPDITIKNNGTTVTDLQVRVCGKNLIQYPNGNHGYEFEWDYDAGQSINGVTYVVNEDGTINAEGECNADTTLHLADYKGADCVIISAKEIYDNGIFEEVTIDSSVSNYVSGMRGGGTVEASSWAEIEMLPDSDCVRFKPQYSWESKSHSTRIIIPVIPSRIGTKNGIPGGQGAYRTYRYAEFSEPSSGIKLSEYPYCVVAYKTNISPSDKGLTINMSTFGGDYASDEYKPTNADAKIFFNQLKYRDINGDNDNTIHYAFADYTEKHLRLFGKNTRAACVYIPVYHKDSQSMSPDDYFDIKYIAFFKDDPNYYSSEYVQYDSTSHKINLVIPEGTIFEKDKKLYPMLYRRSYNQDTHIPDDTYEPYFNGGIYEHSETIEASKSITIGSGTFRFRQGFNQIELLSDSKLNMTVKTKFVTKKE